jgi:hypothetical protein
MRTALLAAVIALALVTGCGVRGQPHAPHPEAMTAPPPAPCADAGCASCGH